MYPAVLSPTTNTRPVFCWHPVPNELPYTVQIDTTSFFTAPLITTTVSDTFFNPLVNLPPDTIYWRVKGDSTAFSATGSFILEDIRVPLLIPYEPKITQVRRPLLQWHAVAGASGYTVAAFDSLNFSTPVFSLDISDTFFKVLSDLPYGNIYWKAKSNLVNTWSTIDQFMVLPDSIPDLIRYNGDSVSIKRPVFAWHPVANASDYLIEIAGNSGFSNAMSLKVSDTAFVPLADLGNGTWYWKVSCSRNYALFAPLDSVQVDVVSVGRNPAVNIRPFVRIVKSNQCVFISFSGYGRGEVNAVVYSVRGQQVSQIRGSDYGQDMMVWDYKDNHGKRVTNGIYLLEIQKGAKIIKQKIIVKR